MIQRWVGPVLIKCSEHRGGKRQRNNVISMIIVIRRKKIRMKVDPNSVLRVQGRLPKAYQSHVSKVTCIGKVRWERIPEERAVGKVLKKSWEHVMC